MTREQIEAIRKHCENNGAIELGSAQTIEICNLALANLGGEVVWFRLHKGGLYNLRAFDSEKEAWQSLNRSEPHHIEHAKANGWTVAQYMLVRCK